MWRSCFSWTPFWNKRAQSFYGMFLKQSPFEIGIRIRAFRITFHENKLAHKREHFKENNILNIYQLNIFNNLIFLHRVKNEKVPNVFLSKFLSPSHHYPTSLSWNNCILPSFKLTKNKYRITIRAPKLRNIIMNIEEKT